MTNLRQNAAVLALTVAIVAATALGLRAQVGKSITVADANAVAENELASYPHMTPTIAKALVAKRPFASIKDLNALLLSQGLTQAQANEFYGKAFVHINLNTATSSTRRSASRWVPKPPQSWRSTRSSPSTPMRGPTTC